MASLQAALDLTLRDLTDFLTERDVPTKCEVCGEENWRIRPEDLACPGIPYRSRDAAVSGAASTSSMIPAFALVCGHCANIRLHDREVIAEWKEKHRPPDAPPKLTTAITDE